MTGHRALSYRILRRFPGVVPAVCACALAGPSAAAEEDGPVAGIPGLFGTGLDFSGNPLPPGEVDPHYEITLAPEHRYGPEAYRVTGWPAEGSNAAWLPNDASDDSKWIGPAAENPNGWFSQGSYGYRTIFELRDVDLASVRIAGRWASDGSGASEIRINGQPVPDSSSGGFGEFSEFAIDEGFVEGDNHLVFRFNNPNDSPTGLRVEIDGQAVSRDRFPFFTSLGEEFDEPLNRMWRLFGSVTELRDGERVVIRFGNEPAYFEWMARKLLWSDERDYRQGLMDRIRNFAMSEDGYLWSWTNRPDWPTDPGALHQENNAKYILAVYRYLMWTRDWGFLDATDTTTRTISGDSDYQEMVDASEGMTLLEKIRLAMEYQLEELNGKHGLLVVNNDHNTGLRDGAPTNYWDNFPFGYKDAYINAYFYPSLIAMSEIEDNLGNEAQAREYRELAALTRRRFTEEFWDLRKNRFVGTIDIEGTVWDLGFTFSNLEALTYGLGDSRQGELILSWLDGERKVPGDTSRGEDIYKFGFAPRSTTVDVADLGEPYWWKDINNQITVGPGGSATYGEHLENGGAILYVAHYDLLARARHRGAEDAWQRFQAIMGEFAVDELLRRPTNNVGANWKLGTIGPFPESGLVPATFLYAFLGLDADLRGLTVYPNLPDDLAYAGVRRLSFGDGLYDVTVQPDRVTFEAAQSAERNLFGVLGTLEPGVAYEQVVHRNGGDSPEVTPMTVSEHGEINFDVSLRRGDTLTLTPAD